MVRNAMTQTTAQAGTAAAPNPEAPPGGEAPPEQGGMPYEKFLKKLAKLGYEVVDGVIVQIGGEAGQQVTDEILALLQKGKNLFGLDNAEYDANRVYYDKGSHDYYGLGTGVSSMGGSPASDQQLALWQSVTGYTPDIELAYWQEHYSSQMPNGYIPAAFQSAEAFARYQEAARNNLMYSNDPAAQREQVPGTWQAAPLAGEEETWLGQEQGRPQQFAGGPEGFWENLNGLGDQDLFSISDTVSQMLQARKQRASARTFQSEFFDFSDFEMEE